MILITQFCNSCHIITACLMHGHYNWALYIDQCQNRKKTYLFMKQVYVQIFICINSMQKLKHIFQMKQNGYFNPYFLHYVLLFNAPTRAIKNLTKPFHLLLVISHFKNRTSCNKINKINKMYLRSFYGKIPFQTYGCVQNI